MKKILLVALVLIQFTANGQSYPYPIQGAKTFPCYGQIYRGDTLNWFWNKAEVIAYVAANAPTQTALNDTAASIRATISGGSSGVTTVNVTAPITSTGGATPTIAFASSAALAGSPTTTTQTAGDNSTKIATTAYADFERVTTTSIHFTSTMILSLNTTPVELVPAQGAGYIIVPISIVDSFTYNTTTYATNTTMSIYETSDKTNPVWGGGSVQILSLTASQIRVWYPVFAANGSTNAQYADNAPLMIYANNGNPDTGDGTFTLYVTWKKVRIY